MRVSLTPTRTATIAQLMMFIIGVLCSSAAMAAQPLSEAFPPYGLSVASNGATSGVLELDFESVLPQPIKQESTLSQTAVYMLAGHQTAVPTMRVQQAQYLLIRNDLPTSTVVYSADDLNAPKDFRLVKSGQLREFQTYALSFPLKHVRSAANSFGQEVLLLKSVSLTIDLGEAPTHPTLTDEDRNRIDAFFGATTDDAENRMLQAQLLNPNLDRSYALTKPSEKQNREFTRIRAWADLVNQTIDAGNEVHKFRVAAPGYVTVRQADLQTTVPAKKWALYFRGDALQVSEVTDEFVTVLVPDYDRIQIGDETVWVLTAAEEIHRAPPMIPLPNEDNLSTTATVQLTEEYLTMSDYHPRLQADSEVTRWYWKNLAENRTTLLNYFVPPYFAPANDSTATLTIYAQAPDPISDSAQIDVEVNGVFIATYPYPLQTKKVAAQIPAQLFKSDTTNSLMLKMRFSATASNRSELLVQKLRLEWSQEFDALLERTQSANSQTPVRFSFDAETTFVATRLPLAQLLPLHTTSSPVNASLPVENTDCRYYYIGAHTGRKFSFPNSIARPIAPTQMSRLDLLDQSQPTDALYIAPKTFLSHLDPLVQHRKQQGWLCTVTDTETIFDNFGFGTKSPEAIRNYLAWVYFNYPAPKLKFVTLVGEASDCKVSPAMPGIPLDLVPVTGGPRSNDARGDHEYSLVAGEDHTVDLMVGRLSVATPEELKSVVRKILQYESQPAQEWGLKTLFVYDDNDEFSGVVDEVIHAGLSPLSTVQRLAQADYFYNSNSKVTYRKRANGATDALMQAMNAGAGLVNYFGHGGPNLWSHERLLHLSDITSRLDNADCLPFITCSSCDNAWLDYPMPPVFTSMGELFLKNPTSGAIAIFAPVSGASPYEHKTLMSHLNTAIWRNGLRTAGEITAFSKNRYYATVNSVSLPQQYILLGDPLTALKIPTPQVQDRVGEIPHNTNMTLNAAENLLALAPTVTAQIKTAKGETVGQYTFDQHTTSVLTPRPPQEEMTFGFLQYPAQDNIVDNAVISRFINTKPLLLLATKETSRARINPILLANGEATTLSLTLTNLSNAPIQNALLTVARENGGELKSVQSTAPRIAIPANSNVTVELFVTYRSGDRFIATAFVDDTNVYPPLGVEFPIVEKMENGFHFLTSPRFIVVSPDPPDATAYIRIQTTCVNTAETSSPKFAMLTMHNGKHIATTTTIEALHPGESNELTISLYAPLPAGKNQLELALINPETLTTFSITLLPIDVVSTPQVSVNPATIRLESQSGLFVSNETLFVKGKIRNRGNTRMRNVTMEIVRDFPASDKTQQSHNEVSSLIITNLDPNETREFTFRWENYNARAGEQFFLVLNRLLQPKGAPAPDSWIALSVPAARDQGDFTVGDLRLSRNLVRPGESVVVTGNLANNGFYPRNDVEYSFGLANVATLDESMQKSTVKQLNKRYPLFETVVVQPGFSSVKVNNNSNREIEESNPGNNTATAPFTLLFDAQQLAQPANKIALSMKSVFSSFDTENIELVETEGFRQLDNFTSSTGVIPISTDMVEFGNIETSAALYNLDREDSKWTVGPWFLRAWPTENAGVMGFQIPLAAPDNDMMYEVKVLADVGKLADGMTLGAFQCRTTSTSAFMRYDPTTMPSTVGEQWITIDNARVTDGVFTPEFKQVGDAATQLKAFELKPLQATLISPAFEFHKPANFDLEIAANLPLRNVTRQYRTGSQTSDGNADWNEWTTLDEDSTFAVDTTNPLLQIRLLLPKVTRAESPTITDLILREK